MNQPIIQIVLIADHKRTVGQVSDLLASSRTGKAALVTVGGEEAEQSLNESTPDLVILDDALTGSRSNSELLRSIRDAHPTLSILMLTRKSDRQGGIEAMKSGATDFIFKRDLNEEVFDRSIRYCLERRAHLSDTHQRNLVIDGLFDQATDALCLMDAEHHITLSNAVFDKRFGKDEKASERLMRMLYEDADLATDERLIDRGDATPLRFFSRWKDKLHKYKLTTRRIDVGKDAWRVLVRISDITVEHQAEQEHLLVEKLKLTERMARILAHEIRNPLTNVQLSVDYMKEAFEGNDDLQMYVEIIERNAVRIDDLVNHILQSIEPFKVKVQAVEPASYFAQVVGKMEDRRELMDAELDLKINTKRKHVMVDPEKLELAMINLMSNAFDAMGGAEKPRLSVVVDDHATGIEIKVQDNGKGMNPEEMEKVFDAFFSNRRGGIGLGTTMIKNIINAHDGNIDVSSQPGEGSCFTIVLPMPQVGK